MKWFSNLKTATKLTVGFGLAMLFLIGTGVVAINRMVQMNAIAHEIATDPLPGVGLIGKAHTGIKQFRVYEFRYLLTENAAAKNGLVEKMQTQQAAVEKAFAEYEKTISQSEDRKNYENLQSQWNAYLAEHGKLMANSAHLDSKFVQGYLSGHAFQTFIALDELASK